MMSRGAPVHTSHPATDLWRPQGDRLGYGDVAWTGAAWGIAMHAILSFFALHLRGLESLLFLFAPAERLALEGLASSPPLARWLALLLLQGVFWALVSVALLGSARETVAVVRSLRSRCPRHALR